MTSLLRVSLDSATPPRKPEPTAPKALDARTETTVTISTFANANTYADNGWSGYGRPTRQQYREKKRLEAEERQAAFDREVRDVAAEQNCHPNDARYVVNARHRHEHRLAQR